MKLSGRLRVLILLSFGACRDFDLAAAQCVEQGRCALLDAGQDAGLGVVCNDALDCESGRCVDGRCCNSECASACDFCDLPGLEGQCRVAALGRTPSVACEGGYACNGTSAECSTSCASDAGCVGARCGSGAVCIEKVVQLKDDFTSGRFEPSIWASPGPNCSVVNQQFHATTAPGAVNFARVYSRRRYDLIDSELRLELISAGNQSLATMQALAGGCDFATGLRCLYLTVGNGQVHVQMSDDTTYSAPLGYFPLQNFRAVRLREQAGTLFLEARNADAGFQQLGSVPTPLASYWRDMRIGLGAGTYGAEATSSTVIWDNVNTP
ncbi:MAG: hypothetical protein Q8N23_27475 [Archangium sp.]|nr:hypothetical protein [Archangium sp.]MDP3156448.1 hypothetical protein [Archangium sp.]MDP3573106.1 hypothetical protein [Archangium sp.]